MSMFNRILMDATHLYFSTEWNYDAFVKAQKLRDRVITCRNNSNITNDEYKALYPLVNHLIDKMRAELKRQRRKEA